MVQPVALVTGGAVRVGAAISRALAGAGYRVAVNYNASAAAAEALVDELRVGAAADAIAVAADISDAAAVEALVDTVVDRFGGIDVLVNNAAVFDERCFLDIDDDLWNRTLSTNLTGPFYVSRAVAGVMQAAGKGRIINICGTAGVTPVGNYAAYCAAKAGLDMLTKCMAQALAPALQVNGVAPGTVLFPPGTAAAERRRVIGKIPGGAIGAPQDVAEAVIFLARAPEYLTGAIITVDGGAGLGSL